MFAALESSTDVLDDDSTDAFQVLSEMCTFIYNAQSKSHHPPTSPNSAPATQNESDD